jgi:hypothetical protein
VSYDGRSWTAGDDTGWKRDAGSGVNAVVVH